MWSVLHRLWAPAPRSAEKSKQVDRRRFAMEALEDRTVPTTFTVSNLNDAGAGSLRQAVLDSNAQAGGNNIAFASGLTGTIALISGQINILNQLEIDGPGADGIIVSGDNQSRIFNVDAGQGTAVTMIGLDLTNGKADQGGAVLNKDSTLSLISDTVRNNAASKGGGVAVIGNGTVSLSGSVVSTNSATAAGGGVYASGGGVVLISASTIAANTAQPTAGATGALATAQAVAASGGGVAIDGATLGVANSTIDKNASSGQGGGVAFLSGAQATISQSTISDNTSSGGGGGGVSTKGSLTIQNSTVADNVDSSGLGGGGVIVQAGGVFNLQSSIVANNTSNGVGADVRGALTTSGNNLIGISSGASGFVIGDLTNVDPKLGPLQFNGGPTATRVLTSGSPAVGAGANPQSLTIDQRGYTRLDNGAVDIGAVSYDSVPPTATLTSHPDISSATNALGYRFTVQYSDNEVVQLSSIANQTIQVTGPNGYSQAATIVSVDQSSDGTPLNVVYQITTPGGAAWLTTDDGTYAISSVGGSVKDGQGNTIAPGVLGAFNIQVAPANGYVQALYQSVLGRAADQAGLAAYQNELNGGASRGQVAREIWTSDEHRTQQIEQYYHKMLNRAADAQGISDWLAAFHHGATEEDVLAGIAGSAEYQKLHSGNEAVVRALYTDILGRTGDAGGVKAYTDGLNSGTTTIAAVARQMAVSNESRQTYVDAYYNEFLNRTPEQATVTGYFGPNLTITDLAMNILASDEYYTVAGLKF